jgi:hypothetical protein
MRAIVLSLAMLVAARAMAGDGRLEVNQTRVQAAGGFPFVINQSGSYVLTGNLVVPAGVTGIRILAESVFLDLNGFAIRGPFACSGASCQGSPVGNVYGIEATGGRATITDGSVSGFETNCVQVEDGRVEGLMVSNCGLIGIGMNRGLLLGNRVSFCAFECMELSSTGTTYANNSFSDCGQVDGTPRLVAGGRNGGGNVCHDRPCPGERRRYYLTTQTFPGNHGANVCAPGFHMASIHELRDTTQLAYHPTLGATSADAGAGPPLLAGWMRTGASASAGSPVAGSANCAVGQTAWASNSASDFGSAASLTDNWNDTPAYRSGGMWEAGAPTCNQSLPAWCVED